MKVLYLSKTDIPSRTANSLHVMKMCQAFAQNRHEVCFGVLTEQRQDTVQDAEIFQHYAVRDCFAIQYIPVYPDKGKKIRFLLSHLFVIPYLLNILRKIRPDVVYGRDIFSCYVAACAGYPVIAESHFPLWHGKVASFAFTRLIKRKEFKRLVVISEALRKVYLKQFPELSPEQVVVAHDGADPAIATETAHPFSGSPERLQAGYIGHLYPGKGVEVVAAIAPRMPDVDFHIIGGLEEDIQKWKGVIKEKNVVFHGFIQQENLPDYLHGLDVCLLPNQYTVLAHGADPGKSTKNISRFTSPLKMFEYMAYGKAIVASDLPVLREVLHEEIALLVKPDDYSGWVTAISRLGDSTLRDKLGLEAQRLFLEKYSWQKRAAMVLQGAVEPAAACEK